MIQLYDFQRNGVNNTRDLLRKNTRVILCSPTGSGKTITACDVVRLALESESTIAVLVNRVELLKQFYGSLNKFNIDVEIVDANSRNVTKAKVYLCMVETLYRRLPKYSFLREIDLLIFDEAHSSVYYKIIEAYPNSFCIGLTATPQASGGSRPLKEYYEDITELAQVEDLIKKGFLVDCKTYSIKADTGTLKKKGKDFSEESQLEFFHSPKLYEGDIDNYAKHSEGKKFIAYCVNVAHSIETAEKFTKAGYPCKHIDGNTPKDLRDLILSQLKSGEILGISNFGIVTAGFDEDSIECIIQNFATAELSKHIQTAGRGARVREGKTHFDILDMGGNYARHGLWNSNRDWTDIFWNPSGSSERERQRQEAKHNLMCEICGYVLNIKDESCPHCGKEVLEMLQEKCEEAKGVELKEIRKELASRIPIRLRKNPRNMSYEELYEYGGLMGYSKKWAGIQMGLRRKSFVRKINR